MIKLNINKNKESKVVTSNQELHNVPSSVNDKKISNKIDQLLLKNNNDFTEYDISEFQKVYQLYRDEFIENSQKIINKLFSINRFLLENKSVSFQKECTSIPEILLEIPSNFRELDTLVKEIVEDDLSKGDEFLTKLNKGLKKVDSELNKDNFNIYTIYDLLSNLLIHLENYNFTQQKYIYRKIADIINQKNTDYTLVSPEDGGIVDLKFHKIVLGHGGHRIKRGLSYILLDRKNEEVLKFGQVKVG